LALKKQNFAEAEMEAIQQKIVEAKKNERADALKEVNRLCKEFGFTAGMLKSSLTEGRKKLSNTHNQFRLANDPDTALQKLENLAHSKNELIRIAVALNLSAITNILVRLFSDEREQVQECLRKRVESTH
jgi:hypothetical protein